MEYKPRIIDKIISKNQELYGTIFLKGPKWCGKTTTCRYKSKTVFNLSDKRQKSALQLWLDSDSNIVFKNEIPILFDEWQNVPELYDVVRNFVDEHDGFQAFLTGSKTLSRKALKENVTHSGVGRIKSIMMRPMSLFESGESNGSISLYSLFENNAEINGLRSSLELDDLIFATCRGGWPKAVTVSKENSLSYARDIVSSLYDPDTIFIEAQNDDESKMNPEIIKRMLRSFARNICTLAKDEKIIKDINADGEFSISRPTFETYENYLKRKFVLEEVEAYCPLTKSRANFSSLPKKAFMDPSLAIACLSLNPNKFEKGMFDFGFFFENLVLRDLRIYCQEYGGEVRYFHDRNGLEADAVIILEDGRYALVEIKLGQKGIEDGIKHLVEIKEDIKRCNEENIANKKLDRIEDEPSALIVITGSKEAFISKEGVYVVPIGCLRD